MDFWGACPFSESTGPGLVHKKCFLGALYLNAQICSQTNINLGIFMDFHVRQKCLFVTLGPDKWFWVLGK